MQSELNIRERFLFAAYDAVRDFKSPKEQKLVAAAIVKTFGNMLDLSDRAVACLQSDVISMLET